MKLIDVIFITISYHISPFHIICSSKKYPPLSFLAAASISLSQVSSQYLLLLVLHSRPTLLSKSFIFQLFFIPHLIQFSFSVAPRTFYGIPSSIGLYLQCTLLALSSLSHSLCLSLLIPRSLSRCTHSLLDSSAAIGFLSKSFCLGQNALMQPRPSTPLLDISSSPRLTHIINHSYAILFMPLDKTPSQARLFAPMPTANRV